MSDGPKKYPRKSTAAKKREAGKQPTPRQSRFAKALMKSKNLAQAAIAAGYSPEECFTVRAPSTRKFEGAGHAQQRGLFHSCDD